jgi:general secretion pathway protein G
MMTEAPRQSTMSWDNGIRVAYFAIVLLAVALTIPNLIGKQGNRPRATESAIAGYENAAKLYAVEHRGQFPAGSSEEVMEMLMSPGTDAEGKPTVPYLEKPPRDVWGRVLYYEFPNSKVPNAVKPAIWSSGENKQNDLGEGDDITNWNETGQ